MTATLVPPPQARPRRPARSRGGWFGSLLLRLHFYAGLLVGPFILVAATSGALYAIAPTLDELFYGHELHAPATATSLSLAEQIIAAETYAGEGAVLTAVRPAPEPGDTTRVMFAGDDLGASESRAVFVDPGTGEIRGDLTAYGTSGSLPVRTWISNLHRNLHLGEPGRLYSELAASWLAIIVLAGAVLWVHRIRKARVKRELVMPAVRRGGYRRLFSWHASVGIWVLLGALMLSATGITWSTYAGANVSALRAAIGGATPVLQTDLSGAEAAPDEHAAHHGGAARMPTGEANPATFEAVLAIARRINVDTGEVEIKPPAASGQAWTVTEIKRSFPTQADAVAIDGATMQVVSRVDFAQFPLLAKLARWGIDLHMGVLFGWVNQLALLFIAVGIGTLVVLGYAMWWTGGNKRWGSAPARGGLRAAPWWGVLSVVAIAGLIGWWLPLVGYPLIAFVVIDVLLGLRTRIRAC
ncbi:PepSY domain-containing protein [Microbacterium sp. SORGH_AS_0862]|uniref:PepSY-associated TM helix domain-containing protein n=1 Tax=Microbacterium sp. SORGH_AS_0862 TaxID=3041789 RepID=UPI00278DDBC9|nr:PepSY-associated TM helix domain-containing protein [Microbacterium sp. SORGH_AS_0862]MDQ1207066.1 putative iron-regulated membrane protein [Microbacterium sp. SORGH_AS_0862]